RSGKPVQLLGDPRVRIRVVARGPELPLAKETAPARDGERDDDAIADSERGIGLADVDDLAHELVAENVAGLHRRDEAVEEMKIRSADRRQRAANDCVARI